MRDIEHHLAEMKDALGSELDRFRRSVVKAAGDHRVRRRTPQRWNRLPALGSARPKWREPRRLPILPPPQRGVTVKSVLQHRRNDAARSAEFDGGLPAVRGRIAEAAAALRDRIRRGLAALRRGLQRNRFHRRSR